MDSDKIENLVSRCEKIEQYTICVPELCPGEYIKVCVWKAFKYRYWVQCNLTLHFIEMDLYDTPCGGGDTPQEAFQEFLADLTGCCEKYKQNTAEVIFEDFP